MTMMLDEYELRSVLHKSFAVQFAEIAQQWRDIATARSCGQLTDEADEATVQLLEAKLEEIKNLTRLNVDYQRQNAVLAEDRDKWLMLYQRAQHAEADAETMRDRYEHELAGVRALLDDARKELDGFRRADMQGAVLIARERLRQVTEEGYTLDMDAEDNTDEQLAIAAMLYVAPTLSCLTSEQWPWDPATDKRPRLAGNLLDNNTLSTPDRIRQLEKAGAFIAAEIDRLRRSDGSQ